RLERPRPGAPRGDGARGQPLGGEAAPDTRRRPHERAATLERGSSDRRRAAGIDIRLGVAGREAAVRPASRYRGLTLSTNRRSSPPFRLTPPGGLLPSRSARPPARGRAPPTWGLSCPLAP